MQFFKILLPFLPKKTTSLLLVASLFCLTTLSTSCGSNKTGCPINESVTGKTNRKGELSNKRGKSNLFPKKVRKKLGGK